MDPFSISQLRFGLGQSLISLVREYPTQVCEEDGNSWYAFVELEADANYGLLQDSDANYTEKWMEKMLATQFEHYLFVCGEAKQHAPLLEKDYIKDPSLPFMAFDLDRLGGNLKEDARVRKATKEDRSDIAELLAESFDTTDEGQRAFASSAGHSSAQIGCFVVEEEEEIVACVVFSLVGEIAGVWSMAVAESARRRGLGTAVLSTVLYHVRLLGAKAAVLLATEEGRKLYLSMGWQQLEVWDLWVTRDSFSRVPDLDLDIGKPYLRHTHGEFVATFLKSSPGAEIETSDRHNWFFFVTNSSGNMGLVQNKKYDDVAKWVALMEARRKPALLFVCGHAREFSRRFGPKWRLDHSSAAMAYDLVHHSNRLKADSRVRKATADDRQAVNAIVMAAFKVTPEYPGWLSPHTLGVGHEDPSIQAWVIEVEDGSIQGTATTGVIDDTVHFWGVAVSPDYRRKGLGMALMNTALLHAHQELDCNMGFLLATQQGHELYRAGGWVRVEDWDVLIHIPSSDTTSVPSQ